MNIRARLTLIFFTIVIVVLSTISVSIYVLSSNYREVDFTRRLKNRATNTAKVLVEVEEVNAELLRRMEQNNPASLPNQYIIIYDYKNSILYRSENIERIPIDTTLLNKIRLRKQIEFEYKDFEVIGFLFESRYDRYAIVAAATDVYGIDALHNLRNTLIVIFIISIGFVSILGWFFAGKILEPIAKIVSDVDNITEMNLSRRLDEGKNSDELGKLAATFNRMLQRLQNAFASQKTFIANASHEIKTPITVMSGEIEVTLLHDRNKEYYIKILRSVLQGLKALNRLSTQLLVLAQAEAATPMRDVSSIRIDDVLWEVKDELTKAHPDYIIDIELPLNIHHDALSISADNRLLHVAIMNVIDNGCKYSDNGRVEINIQEETTQRIKIDFINNGSGIPQELLDKIFDPFFRGNASKKVRGSGIGLSLVKRIIEMHKGTVSVESRPHQRTVFTIDLPTAAIGKEL